MTVFLDQLFQGSQIKKMKRKENIRSMYNKATMPTVVMKYTSETKTTKKTLDVKGLTTAATKTNGVVGTVVKAIFSNNMTYYTKGSNSFGGGARSVSNSGAVSRRT